jgi:protein transport protein SEC24
MKSLPLDQLIRYIYPDFYLLDPLFAESGDKVDPPRLQLSAEKWVVNVAWPKLELWKKPFFGSLFRLDSRSMFLMDTGSNMFIYVGSNTNPSTIKNVFGEHSGSARAVCASWWIVA